MAEPLKIVFFPEPAAPSERRVKSLFHIHVNDSQMICGIEKCRRTFNMQKDYSCFRSTIQRHLKSHDRVYDETKVIVHVPKNNQDHVMDMIFFKEWLGGSRIEAIWKFFVRTKINAIAGMTSEEMESEQFSVFLDSISKSREDQLQLLEKLGETIKNTKPTLRLPLMNAVFNGDDNRQFRRFPEELCRQLASVVFLVPVPIVFSVLARVAIEFVGQDNSFQEAWDLAIDTLLRMKKIHLLIMKNGIYSEMKHRDYAHSIIRGSLLSSSPFRNMNVMKFAIESNKLFDEQDFIDIFGDFFEQVNINDEEDEMKEKVAEMFEKIAPSLDAGPNRRQVKIILKKIKNSSN